MAVHKSFLDHKVTQSTPSPALCLVETQDAQNSHIAAFYSGDGSTNSDNESSSSKTTRDVHISMRLMEDFLHLAKDNTEKDLETCGILGAFLEKGTLYMTTLIIPKQETASNSCQATNEEEVFTILSERSLYPVGWIHTHPSQSCFMSSVDLHTQYSYQVMIKNLEQVVAMVLNSFPDQHPRVRWAAINAIGQLSTDLGPDLQVQYHQGLLPALAAATDDFQNPRVQIAIGFVMQGNSSGV